MAKRFKRYPEGARIGEDLTLVSAIANARGRHPIYVAWSHAAWAPLACKVFRTTEDAEREFEALRACAHPNVVRAYFVQRPAMLLMELLDGQSLRSVLRQSPGGRVSVADAMRLGVHIGAALSQVHRAGYTHLDIKPENIIAVAGRPVLFDFGSARRIGARRPSSPQGTDAYMSPEERTLKDVGPAGDVFSLGVVLYELLTARLPFGMSGAEPFAGPASRHRRIGRRLDEVLTACLAEDPAARPGFDGLLPALNAEIRSGPRMWPSSLPIAGRGTPVADRRMRAGSAPDLAPMELTR